MASASGFVPSSQPLASKIAHPPKVPMQYVKLAPSCGLKVSRICLGMMSYGDPKWRSWVLPEAESVPFVNRALELGINFFDTADMYSLGVSEVVLGNCLRAAGYNREQIVIASKARFDMGGINMQGLSRKHLIHAVDNSLKRLGMDYIDLFQIHRWDPETPIEETMKALHDIVQSGKVRYIGASSMYSWQFAKAQFVAEKNGWTKFVTMQNHYNLVYREEEREMIPCCIDQGVGCLPWSPLARGFLAGNRTLLDKELVAAAEAAKAAKTGTAADAKAAAPAAADSKDAKTVATTRIASDPMALSYYYSAGDFAVVERVIEIAKKRGVPPAQIALAWILSKPGVTSPIIGATKMSHLEDAVASLSIKLTEAEIKAMEELYQPHKVLGNLY